MAKSNDVEPEPTEADPTTEPVHTDPEPSHEPEPAPEPTPEPTEVPVEQLEPVNLPESDGDSLLPEGAYIETPEDDKPAS